MKFEQKNRKKSIKGGLKIEIPGSNQNIRDTSD
jgi:hypothetical protein